MRRIAVFVSFFIVLSGILAFGRGTTASAQDAMATHPVVGLWRFTTDLGGGITIASLAMFHADGTYIEDFPDAGSFSMGVWEPTGPRTATFTFYQVYTIDDKLVEGVGRSTAEVDETGNGIFTTGSFVGTFEDGTIEFRRRYYRVRRGRPGARCPVRRAATGAAVRIGARGHAGDPGRHDRSHRDAVARETLPQARAGIMSRPSYGFRVVWGRAAASPHPPTPAPPKPAPRGHPTGGGSLPWRWERGNVVPKRGFVTQISNQAMNPSQAMPS
jgi:hypothetical protein